MSAGPARIITARSIWENKRFLKKTLQDTSAKDKNALNKKLCV